MSVQVKTAEQQIEAFKAGFKGLRDARVEVIPSLITLGTLNRWEQLPQPPRYSLFWTLRNENAANFLNVSYEQQVPAANPNFFFLSPLNGNRDTLRETWVPSAIWARAPDAVPHIIYFEYAILLEEGTDAYRDLSGGVPG